MSTVREFYGMSAVKASKRITSYDTTPDVVEPIDSNIIVGIEVEVENAGAGANLSTGVWDAISDGSLRNSGVEYITSPIPAKYAPYALRELLVDGLRTDCCFSPRTSVHVHVNVQDMETEQVKVLTLLYASFEPLFYKFTGRGRIKNIYCVPLFDTSLMQNMVEMDFNAVVTNWSKYTGFNLVPAAEKGTVEFRQMHGTFDHKKLSIWVRMIVKLVSFVQAMTAEQGFQLIADISDEDGLGPLLEKVFGEDSQYLKYNVWKDVAHARDAVYTAFASHSITAQLVAARTNDSAYFKTKG